MIFKICSTCKQNLPVDEFYKTKCAKDGLHTVCKTCSLSRLHATYEKNKSRSIIEIPEFKYCSRCELLKHSSEFSVSKTRKAGLGVYCKQCYIEKNAEFKLKILSLLGGPFCIQCGENEFEFLTIQHKQGGGKKHRLSTSWKGIFNDILDDGDRQSKYEVLCANCNIADAIVKQDLLRIHSDFHNHRRFYEQSRKELAFGIICDGIARCLCCGMQGLDKLCIDHIEPYSKSHYGTLKRGINLYYWIIKQKESADELRKHLQVLCFNCNQSKGAGNFCIHQRQNMIYQSNNILEPLIQT